MGLGGFTEAAERVEEIVAVAAVEGGDRKKEGEEGWCWWLMEEKR